MCIQSNDRPVVVSTNEDIEARVMDLGEIESLENLTWMGKRIGKVVHV